MTRNNHLWYDCEVHYIGNSVRVDGLCSRVTSDGLLVVEVDELAFGRETSTLQAVHPRPPFVFNQFTDNTHETDFNEAVNSE